MSEIMTTEPFPGETLIADGWVYRDLPRLTQDAFDKFLGILGAENARFMTFARYPDQSVRGQLLMSPAGMDRLKAYSAAVKSSSLSDDRSAADANDAGPVIQSLSTPGRTP